MKIAIECTAEAVVRERWVLEVSDEEYERIKNDPDEAMELLEHQDGHFVSVENTEVDGERDREFVSIEKVKA